MTIAWAEGTTLTGATVSAVPLWSRSRQADSLGKHAQDGKEPNGLRASSTCTLRSVWGDFLREVSVG